MPLITVLIPVRDRPREVLARTLQSVRESTLADVETVLVDDASAEPVEAPSGVTLLRNERRLGVAGSLNRGLEASDSEFAARLDAGDVMAPHRLAAQLEHMDRLDVCGTALRFHTPEGQALPGRAAPEIDPATMGALLWFHNPVPHPSVLLRRSLLPRAGYPLVDGAEDWALWLEMSRAGARLGLLGEALTSYEVNPESASMSAEAQTSEAQTAARVFAEQGLDRKTAERWSIAVAGQAPLERDLTAAVASRVPSAHRERFLAMCARLEAAQASSPAPDEGRA
ncbi:glycosyltransferase family 2 protein [Arthrobacter sp. UM1]|uniref:glycosyltransferase family 2 protein n=1 Tax=Arthrobacter sp. UM1 TaxID=2766776 RepID=UPI001CF6D884|nr:glycosyltransferase family 2 protein [Arthrobacter sp. UM1]MCB4207202.1 glycosyltransferase family 2 protein [Arthrobacter sp. UM1]